MSEEMFHPEFDSVYAIDSAGNVSEQSPYRHHAPEIALGDHDVYVSDGWNALTGYTGQCGYRGAVMHPSEQWGQWAVDALAHEASDTPIVFAVVEVRDEDFGYPDGDAIGWAVAWRAA